jgi:hypothetical protein
MPPLNSLCRFIAFLSLVVSVTPVVAGSKTITQNGCGNASIETFSGGHLGMKIDCSVQNIYAVRKTVSPYERDLHTLLLSQNPTEFKITAVELSSWLEDGGRTSLSVTFANPRNIPIRSLSVDVLDPKSGASFVALRPLNLARSRIFRLINSTDVSIPANGSTKLPVAFLGELQEKLHDDVPNTYCAFAASIDTGPTMDDKDFQEATFSSLRKQPLEGGASSRTHFSGVLLRIKTTSIFEQKLVSYAWVFVRYADKGSTAELWYPNKKAMEPLKCVDPVELQ